ncbi:MAG: hypothetical protein V4572_07280 [Bacteroidota bacterium]
MKALKLITVGIFLFVSGLMHSQVSVNVNIGTPPPWGPVGYSNVEFYYLPDVEAYYDIRASQFIYFQSGIWTRGRYLPGPHRHYDLYNGYKVVLTDYHGHKPYTHFHDHKVKYHKGYKGSPQKSIGKKPDHHSNNGHGNNGNGGHKGHKEGKGNKGKGKH